MSTDNDVPYKPRSEKPSTAVCYYAHCSNSGHPPWDGHIYTDIKRALADVIEHDRDFHKSMPNASVYRC